MRTSSFAVLFIPLLVGIGRALPCYIERRKTKPEGKGVAIIAVSARVGREVGNQFNRRDLSLGFFS
jgi:hypothetical protein